MNTEATLPIQKLNNNKISFANTNTCISLKTGFV